MSVALKRKAIVLSEEETQRLQRIMSSRNGPRSAVVRARMLLRYNRGETISAIARREGVTRPTVQLCIDKALSGGIDAAIQDLCRPGRPPVVTTEDKAWVMELACSSPTEHGYDSEVWMLSQLTKHIRYYALRNGHPSLQKVSKTLVRNIIKESSNSPHNVAYYFDKHSLQPREGVASILIIAREIQLFRQSSPAIPLRQTGIEDLQGTGTFTWTNTVMTADLTPGPNSHPLWFQNNHRAPTDSVALTAGIDLHDGRIIALVQDQSNSERLDELLKLVDNYYPSDWRIRMVPGNGTTAASRVNMQAFKAYPNRFEVDDARTDGLLLNLVEVFFARMVKSFLRTVRVISKAEFINRMNGYLDEINLFAVANR